MSARSLATAQPVPSDDGSVSLAASLAGSSRLTDLLDRLLGTHDIVVRDAEVSNMDAEVRVTGTTAVLGAEAVGVDVRLQGAGEDQRLRVALAPPEGWRLSTGFPESAGTEIGDLSLADVELVLDSNADTTRLALALSGNIAVADLLPGLGALVAGERGCVVSGPVVLPGDGKAPPQLAAELSGGLQVGSLPDLAGLEVTQSQVLLEGPWVVDPELREVTRRGLAATVRMGEHDLRLVGLVDAHGYVSMQARPDVSLPSLAELGELIDAEALLGKIPSALRSPAALTLETVDVGIDAARRQLVRLGIGVRFPIGWTPLPGIVSLDAVRGFWTVLDPAGEARSVFSIVADGTVLGEAAQLRASAPDAVLTGRLQRLSLRTALAALGAPAASDVPDLALEELSFTCDPAGSFAVRARAEEPWHLGVGPVELEVADLRMDVLRVVTSEGAAVTGGIAGRLTAPFGVFDLDYRLPASAELRGRLPSLSLSKLLREVVDVGQMIGLGVPLDVLDLTIEDVEIAVSTADRSLRVSGGSGLGSAEIAVRKRGGQWGFAAGFVPGEGWRLSNLAPELAPLDALTLSRPVLVLASHEDDAMTIPGAPAAVPVRRGFTVLADLSLDGTGLEHVLGAGSLQVRALVGSSPAETILEAALDLDLELGPDVRFLRAALRVEPGPVGVVVALLGELEILADGDLLRFTGALEVQPRSAELTADMRGRWSEPFGLTGLELQDVSVALGVSYPPLLPTLTMAGTLMVGSVAGSAAVRFDAANPGRSMLAVAFGRLGAGLLVRSIVPEVVPLLGGPVLRVLDGCELRDLALEVIPQTTRIGDTTYEAGIRAAGTLMVDGFVASADFRLDPAAGVVAVGSMSPIKAGDIFELLAYDGVGGPRLDLDLRAGHESKLHLDGRVRLLGLETAASVSIDADGTTIDVEGRIFDVFEAELHVAGASLREPQAWRVEARLQADFMTRVREAALAEIARAASAVDEDLRRAQDDVESARADVSRLDGEIEVARAAVRSDRSAETRRRAEALRDVTAAERGVAQWNEQIESARRAVAQDRTREERERARAQEDVRRAQQGVDGIQRDIDASHASIARIQAELRRRQAEVDRTPWPRKIELAAALTAFAVAKNGEIGAIYGKIGALETARATARAGLDAAKLTLDLLGGSAAATPVDADPRVFQLVARRDAEMAALRAARAYLEEISKGDPLPVDADPRVAGLFVLRDTARAGLDAATEYLQLLRDGNRVAADAASFAAEHGLGGVLDVRAASFVGELAGVSGARVDVSITVSFLRAAPHTYAIRCDLRNPAQAVTDLVNQLLAG